MDSSNSTVVIVTEVIVTVVIVTVVIVRLKIVTVVIASCQARGSLIYENKVN